jgi:DNA repair exonuclease SbcCD nuclease subunit
MRFIHSSDLQIGMVFNYFELDIAFALQDARQAVVHTLGERAQEYGATAVLLAGDTYDKQQLSSQTLAKPIEAMRRFPRIKWHLLPGNHDYVRENGLWDRLGRLGLPANVHVYTNPGAVEIAGDAGTEVFLLPAPLRYRSNDDDLTAYMDSAPTPEGAIRIGMAHGSIQGFGSEGEAKNYIAPDRAEKAGLAYLALGDWHRQLRVKGASTERRDRRGVPRPLSETAIAARTGCAGRMAPMPAVGGRWTLAGDLPQKQPRHRVEGSAWSSFRGSTGRRRAMRRPRISCRRSALRCWSCWRRSPASASSISAAATAS